MNNHKMLAFARAQEDIALMKMGLLSKVTVKTTASDALQGINIRASIQYDSAWRDVVYWGAFASGIKEGRRFR